MGCGFTLGASHPMVTSPSAREGKDCGGGIAGLGDQFRGEQSWIGQVYQKGGGKKDIRSVRKRN